MKKLMLLGGLRYLIPVIETAHKEGIYVITCDYLPNNIAHKYSDEYYNVNITNKEAVLRLANELRIDGIMSFAVDPGVITAAYVANKMNLPAPGPYESVKILQNKALFRRFLEENNFNVPKARGYNNVNEALSDYKFFNWPVIVKPVDSAGSKGVQKVDDLKCLKESILHSLSFSKIKEFIIEDFIEQKGYSTDSDSFSLNGELIYFTLSNQRFDADAENPYTPSGFSWPSSISPELQSQLRNEIQRLLSLLKMDTSLYNIEARIGTDNKAYIMEVSPRGGGNRLSEMIYYATGVDLIKHAVKSAIGECVSDLYEMNYKGNWGEIILHSETEGVFDSLEIDSEIKKYVVEVDLWVKDGDLIKSFTGANETIGTIVVNCDNQKQLNHLLDNYKKWVKIKIKKS